MTKGDRKCCKRWHLERIAALKLRHNVYKSASGESWAVAPISSWNSHKRVSQLSQNVMIHSAKGDCIAAGGAKLPAPRIAHSALLCPKFSKPKQVSCAASAEVAGGDGAAPPTGLLPPNQTPDAGKIYSSGSIKKKKRKSVSLHSLEW